MRIFIMPWDYSTHFCLRDISRYSKLNCKLWWKILKHFWRVLAKKERVYRVQSQISGETLASTGSLKEARIVAHEEGFITWGQERYPRRYVTNEDGLVVYAPSLDKPPQI